MLSKRAQQLKPSPTLALASKAKELKAQGHDVISLSVGEPDWDTFSVAMDAGISAINAGMTKYVPASGIPELKAAVAKQTNQDLGLDFSPSEVTVSAGAKFVLFSALQALVDPGDEVLIPAPYWVSYPVMAELAGGVPVYINSQGKNGHKITAEELENKITSKTKILILNSPSNPTGAIYSKEELKSLAQVLQKHNHVFVISDDIYNRLVFDESGLAPHILQVCPDLKDRVLIVNGASKTYSMTGWRVGWAVGNASVIQAMNHYQSQSVSCSPGFSQKATLAAIESGEGELKASLKLLKERADFCMDRLKRVPLMEASHPQGTFYLWISIAQLLTKSYKGKPFDSSRDFCQALLSDQNVVTVPGVEFGGEGYIRASYALSPKRLEDAFNRIEAFISELK